MRSRWRSRESRRRAKLGPVGLEPLVELTQRLDSRKVIEPTLGVAANLDEAGIVQHLEMPGHARLVHTDGAHEFRHRALTDPHDVEDPTACRFGDHLEDGKFARHPMHHMLRYIYMHKKI